MPELPTDASGFWSYLDRLVADCPVVFDRPRGSKHPRYPDLEYPLDYGYLDGTTSIDGGGLDLFRGSRSGKSLDAVALTVDLEKRDAEIKLLLGCTEIEIREVMEFLNGVSMRATLVRRDGELGFLKSRRSVRHFQSRSVPRDVLDSIMEAATLAPSAHNRQPWRFLVLRSLDARKNLAQAMAVDFRRDQIRDGFSEEQVESQVQRSRQRIEDASVAVLLCLDTACGDDYTESRRQQAEFLMGVQSLALAGGQLLLAAHAQGLAGVWMCAPIFAPQKVREAFGLHENLAPQGLILLGYPAKFPPARPRRPLEEIARFL